MSLAKAIDVLIVDPVARFSLYSVPVRRVDIFAEGSDYA